MGRPYDAAFHEPDRDTKRMARSDWACTADGCVAGRARLDPPVLTVTRIGRAWKYEATCRRHATFRLWWQLRRAHRKAKR